jgi:ketosteroid isomerase-like protein
MQEAQNTRTVQDAYAAFLKGDLNGVLATLDDQVVWKPVTGASPDVPMSGTRRGKTQVAEFFGHVARDLTFSRFEPQQFVAQGEKVVALGHYSATTIAGGSFDSDFVMVFTVRHGKVVEFQEFLDVAQLNAAFAGVAAR